MDGIKRFWKNLVKFWDFIWNDDSALSWVLNIIVAVILIKFIVYPGLGLLLGTPYPIVAVVSGSMEHGYAPEASTYGGYIESDTQIQYKLCDDTKMVDKSIINLREFVPFTTFWSVCGGYYEARGIEREEFETFPFKNGFNTGDIMILYGSKAENIKIGDIIVFQGARVNPKPDPIIHRVISIKEGSSRYVFGTKGDHNHDTINKCNNNRDCIYESDIWESQVIAKAVIRIPYLGYIKIGAFNLFTKVRELL